MQIIYPYQVQRLRPMPRRLRGLGAICDYTPGCACKTDIEPLYAEINRLRNEIQSLLGQYGAFVPEWLKLKFANQEKEYLKVYEGFKRADERCYGNWREAISETKPNYETILEQLNDQLTRQAAAINASGGGSSGSLIPGFDTTYSAPIIPGTSAALNPWLIAGVVGVALFVGYKLMTNVK